MPITIDAETYRSILEAIQSGLYLVDRDRRIIAWSDGAERITGYHRHEVIGRLCRENILVHCDEAGEELCANHCPLHHSMMDGMARQADVYLRHKNGHRVPIRIHAMPIRDAAGVIIGATETFDERRPAGTGPCAVDTQTFSGDGGLLSNQAITLLLSRHVHLFERQQIPFSIAMLRIDRFQHFREVHGQQAVDAIMAEVAETALKCLRVSDGVGRWSDDRLLLILSGCSEQALESIAARLQHLISVTAVPWWGDRVSTTVSIGAAAVQMDDTAELLVGRAEEVLDASGRELPE